MLLNLGREHPIEHLEQAADGARLPELSRQIWDVHVDDTVRDYVVRIVHATRQRAEFLLGASPRGSYALYRGSQAYAAIQGRDYVLPDDVKALAPSVLSHRCLMHPQSALRGVSSEDIIGSVLEEVSLEIGELDSG
jgi:MoxR-like ATPase